MILAIIQCLALIVYGQDAKGLELLRKAERGDIDAMRSACIGYQYGISGLPKDLLKQAYWTKKGAEAGDIWCMLEVALLYHRGDGFEINKEEAFKWLLEAENKLRAANKNDEDYAGLACVLGRRIVFYNVEKTFEWLTKSAEAGYVEAMQDLSWYYRSKDGFEDDNLAIYWAKKYLDAEYAEEGSFSEYCDEYKFLLSKGIKYNPKDKTESSTSIASSESHNHNSNVPKGLLYKGAYTVSQQGYCAELGRYTEAFGADYSVDIEIYEDYLWITGAAPAIGRYDYVRTSGDWKIYEGATSLGTTYYYKVNPHTFNMVHYCTMYNQYTGSTNTWTYSVGKGEVVFNRNSNASIPAGGYSNSSNSVEKTSSGYTRSQKVCGTCDGKGWIPSTRGVASLGQSEKWCPECKKMVPANHYHETCPSCNGKGKW